MAASDDSPPELTEGKNDSLSAATESDVQDHDVQFKDPLETGLKQADVDEGIESLKSEDRSVPSEPDTPVSCTSSNLTSAQSDVDNDDAETKDLFVRVDSPEKHTTTLEAYITFRVSTKTTRVDFGSSEYTVRRRFNDFLWLRQKLEESYPTHLVPPLPEKQSLTRLDRFNLDFVRSRQKSLHKFLTRLADHPVVSFDKHFAVFLTANASEFRSHRKSGKDLLEQMSESMYNLSASYMMRNRPVEFSQMYDYVNVFGDKMGVLDRISTRVLKEQQDYLSELCSWGPSYVMWGNSEDGIKAALLAMESAVDKCCTYFKELVDQTDDNILMPLKEYILYTECIKAVLRKRDAIQMEYDRVVDELNRRKDERERVKISDQTYSFGSFLGKDPQEVKVQKEEKVAQQVAQLMNRKEELSDKTEVADANLKADMERWKKTQRRDLKEMLMGMADRQILFYTQSLSGWQDAIRGIQKPQEEEADGEDEEIFDFSRVFRGSRAGRTAGAGLSGDEEAGGVTVASVLEEGASADGGAGVSAARDSA